ncbi:hypothetical protein Adi01nite_24530 [Amorphoplanes digitatis]|uniref:Uncharacterized protein n=1 Tax=Actinoplanes digitatis TaxID=1868 RepID=A0A7W7MQX6_9ACTN|nr:hypothetical protein [Actinoplanes digitatis]GID93041.1 hypothetical protein Adi01nite_24530 [Actinoplanes digitatis]
MQRLRHAPAISLLSAPKGGEGSRPGRHQGTGSLQFLKSMNQGRRIRLDAAGDAMSGRKAVPGGSKAERREKTDAVPQPHPAHLGVQARVAHPAGGSRETGHPRMITQPTSDDPNLTRGRLSLVLISWS